ncbi:MAG: PASTA domain-containing protein [Muribaculaceae bacterium]|nr:PASTA domain-containing protein [Muribaculaceae bacterium]MDE6131188.1 PASTA domain-containing protein [Muribaculaceae bacterium]
MNDFIARIRKSYRHHPVIYNILMAAIAVMVTAWGTLLFLDVWTHHGATSVVPDIKYMDYREAIQELENSNLEIEVSDSVFITDLSESLRKKMEPGMVLESWPKAGAVVKKGRPVYVTIVAYSPKEVVISTPIDNISSRQAVSVLQSLGITNVRLVSVPSLYNDNVERALYNGKTIGVGSSLPVTATVTLEVGKSAAQEPVYETDDTVTVADEPTGDPESDNSDNTDNSEESDISYDIYD